MEVSREGVEIDAKHDCRPRHSIFARPARSSGDECQGVDPRSSLSETADQYRVVILNPVSGGRKYRARVRTLAARLGYVVREIESGSDGIELAEAAVRDGANVVVGADTDVPGLNAPGADRPYS